MSLEKSLFIHLPLGTRFALSTFTIKKRNENEIHIRSPSFYSVLFAQVSGTAEFVLKLSFGVLLSLCCCCCCCCQHLGRKHWTGLLQILLPLVVL